MEERIRRIGTELYDGMQREWSSLQRAHRWEFQVLRWCLADPDLRVRVLRFMDCLPALSDPRDIVLHLCQYFPQADSRLPAPLRLGLAAARPTLLTAPAVAAATRAVATGIARLFIAGSNLEEAAGPIHRLASDGFRVSVDLLGETTLSQSEAERSMQSYLELIERWPSLYPGPIHLSLKLSSLAFPFDPGAPEVAWRQVAPRLKTIFQAVLERGGLLNIDMEQFALRDLTLEIAQRLLEEFPATSALGVVIQSYLKDSEPVTHRLLDWVAERGVPITVRLVRGAYWDTEVILARQRRWPCPVFEGKPQTDACFERLTDLLLQHPAGVRVAVATHNIRSIARAIARAEEWNVPQERWECQMLYGVNPALHRAVRNAGVPVRIYTPIGEWIPGMAYLVRRMLENTSQYSFLSAGLTEHLPAEALLEAPAGV